MTRATGSSNPQSKTAERHGVSPPGSLAALLGEFRGCFSAWTFPVFCALACGLISQTAGRTVCGMLVGAGLSGTWSHHRAHRFFSHARWSVEKVSAVVARLVVRLVVAADAAVTVAIDDTLFSRRGLKVGLLLFPWVRSIGSAASPTASLPAAERLNPRTERAKRRPAQPARLPPARTGQGCQGASEAQTEDTERSEVPQRPFTARS